MKGHPLQEMRLGWKVNILLGSKAEGGRKGKREGLVGEVGRGREIGVMQGERRRE